MPEAVIVSDRPFPHRPRLQGFPQGPAPGRPDRHDHRGRPRQGPRPRPARHRRPDARLRPARRRAGPQPGPHRGRADGHGPPAGLHHHPVLLLLAPDLPDGDARHQGRRGRRVHLGRCRDGVAAPSRAAATACPTPTTRSSRTPRRAPPPSRSREGTSWHDPREDGLIPDAYIAMGQTAENLARLKGISRQEMDEFGVRSQNLAEEAIKNGFWEREITPVTTPDGTVVSKDDGPRAGVTVEGVAGPQAGLPPRRTRHRGQLLPAQRRRRRPRDHERHQGARARPDPAGPHRLHRRHRPVARDHGPRPGRGVPPGAEAGRAHRRTTSTSSRSTRPSPPR